MARPCGARFCAIFAISFCAFWPSRSRLRCSPTAARAPRWRAKLMNSTADIAAGLCRANGRFFHRLTGSTPRCPSTSSSIPTLPRRRRPRAFSRACTRAFVRSWKPRFIPWIMSIPSISCPKPMAASFPRAATSRFPCCWTGTGFPCCQRTCSPASPCGCTAKWRISIPMCFPMSRGSIAAKTRAISW